MGAYQSCFAGQLKDEAYDEKELAQAPSGLPASWYGGFRHMAKVFFRNLSAASAA